MPSYMQETVLDRKTALYLHGGYTELSDTRYILKTYAKNPDDYQAALKFKNSILVTYEYSGNSETGFTRAIALDTILTYVSTALSITAIYGGYKTIEGIAIEEEGLLIASPKLSGIEVGVIALKLAQEFRQESVLVFDFEGAAHFVRT